LSQPSPLLNLVDRLFPRNRLTERVDLDAWGHGRLRGGGHSKRLPRRRTPRDLTGGTAGRRGGGGIPRAAQQTSDPEPGRRRAEEESTRAAACQPLKLVDDPVET
jgi:hypothetical protein